MPPQTLEGRVESLEQRVTILEQLPARVDALSVQISQLREEMHAEFSAVRTEARAGGEEIQRSLREEIRAGDEETRRSLREEMRELHEELKRHMLVLHEDLTAKIALIREGQNGTKRPPAPRPRRK